jgi:hypothetical protein
VPVLAPQVPAPSQAAPDVDSPPSDEHTAIRQLTPAAHFRHAPAPLHRPSLPHVLAAAGGQPPRGSTPPLGTSVHVPTAPPTMQLRHSDWQLVLQQTPSAQKPESHSPPSTQAAPFFLVPQWPLASQRLGATHWALDEHEAKQAAVAGLQP